MGLKPELKLEGDKLVVSLGYQAEVDTDNDGIASAKADVSVKFELIGLEVADELLKSSELAQKIKEKLGMK